MSFLIDAEKLNAANQINAWNTQAMGAMAQAKSAFVSIRNQRVSMEGNSDYSPSDILEVDNILLNLNALANTLITE